MHLAILASEEQQKELLIDALPEATAVDWVHSPEELVSRSADGYADLLFENEAGRIEILSSLNMPVVINSVVYTLDKIKQPFIRMNAWPGFLQNNLIEVVCSKNNESFAGSFFTALNRRYTLLPDNPGMIAPRVIAMIINEAYFAWEEGVSSKEEIDLGMKLGTNYPYGPFEWGRRIGIKNVYSLLTELGKFDDRYQVSNKLQGDAVAGGLLTSGK